jgi:hypothetical protein
VVGLECLQLSVQIFPHTRCCEAMIYGAVIQLMLKRAAALALVQKSALNPSILKAIGQT